MKRLNAWKALSLLVLGLMSTTGQAAQFVKFEFSAHVTNINTNSPLGDYPGDSPLNVVDLGTAVNGYFYYELSTPFLFSDPNAGGGSNTGYSSLTDIGIKFTANGYKFAQNAGYFDPLVIVDDVAAGTANDSLKLAASQHLASGVNQDAELTLTDKHNGGSLSNSSLPTALAFNDYNGLLIFYWEDPSGHTFRYEATLDSLNQVAAVPEPETYAMLLAGLALMGGVARRKSRKSRKAAR